ncbi:alpha-mannosidase [Paenibacillus agricola]|uniref:Alpha-mannosidase n=1 Tax=Paenibacillus agricola TaxID=2716264 RepID=A0ABX0JFA9_9BACL|nr:alpha-mannosidase [Paenibacillus agricola]NHN34218.1 alpha-mannosidase [Paenibacillus agricola]
MFLTLDKLWKRIEEIEKHRYVEHREMPSYSFWVDKEAEIAAMPPEDSEWGHISVGDRWKGWDLTAWLKTETTVPAEWAGRQVVGLFDFGKTGAGHNSGFESLLYVNGEPYQGVGSNHKEVFFPESFLGQKVELLFKVWSGLSGADGTKTEQEHQLHLSALAVLETETDDLYHTAFAVYHTIQVLEENRWERQALVKALDRAMLLLNWRVPGDAAFYASVSEANTKLKEELAKLPSFQPLTVRCIGHTHIDVAWLWRLKHTREKAVRSFSTVLRLMEQFPEYIFLQTQPQLYEYIEQDYPEVFAKIKERVQEGRWEAGGAMWLESDCNIPSGESLVRQLLYGMRYFENTFGVKCEYLWLPDVFGYSWALPQILQKSGLRHFMTTKISWNVYNRFPHDTFYWRGIDGTEVLTHYITTPETDVPESTFTRYYTYNGQVLPSTLSGIWNNYRDKEINDSELLLSYGYGDGGGGPTRTMLEMRRRLENMPGMPRAITGRADEFFTKLEQTVEQTDRYVHHWDGELYLELHRGTYTSQAYVKKMNRHMEFLLRDAEMVSIFSSPLTGYAAYPQKQLYDSWKIVLRNQFHDILPGSSITEVYEDCRTEYAEAEQLAQGALADGMELLASNIKVEGGGWLVVNSLPWPRSEIVELSWEASYEGQHWMDVSGHRIAAERVLGQPGQGDTLQLLVTDIPAMGYTTVRMATAEIPAELGQTLGTAETLEEPQASGADSEERQAKSEGASPFICGEQSVSTPFYEIEWNAAGQLSRVFDKRSKREVLAVGELGNRFDVHEDKPAYHDNWEIDIFYLEKVSHITDLRFATWIEQGPLRAVIRFEWEYGQTLVQQDMIVYAHHPRIDFSTWVDWQERETLLKVAFPVCVRAAAATYEIQFGHVQRPTHWNTSWDYARFETCAHKWVDLSERGFGVSLLNDCKYGHDIKEHVMRLTLIKSSNKPDPECDKGEHTFTYSLLPHGGDWFAAGTVEQAYRLNVPVVVTEVKAQSEPQAQLLSGQGQSQYAGQAMTRYLPAALSFIGVSGDHVMIDTVKKAEDSDSWIVRCYEYAGKRGEVAFATHYQVDELEEVNLSECEGVAVAHTGQTFTAFFKPFELKTFRIVFRMEN